MAKKKKAKKKASKKKATKRGKSFQVTIARLSQDAEKITVPAGSTLADALYKAGFDNLEGMLGDVRVNGKECTLKLRLKKNDFVSISPRVQGGVA